MIITIDGPSGTGKSTVAKSLADFLGFTYFDTGAMYRAFTFYVIQSGKDPHDPSQLEELLGSFDYTIQHEAGHKRYKVNEEDVTAEIRDPQVTERVSEIAAIPEVRRFLVDIQKNYGQRVNAVFEGRDLGTVVFPQAELKVFLTADPAVRAERRYQELLVKFPELKESLTVEQLEQQIIERDEKDMSREVSPLKQAEEAHLIDTSGMSIREVVDTIVLIKEKME